MSSELMFYAHLKLGLPEGVTANDVQGAFETMPDPLTVDLSFS
jgi:glycine cleavage system regulatory protein